jgi:NDP-sugar pyrophosphorylase family protein
MKAVLICPSRRPAVRFLAETMPLSNVPVLGQSLLEYWLGHLAGSGVKHVLVLANDRPQTVQALTGSGTRWGLTVEVRAESDELTPAAALSKYNAELPAIAAQNGVVVMDHFPELTQYPLFTSYRDWFAALCAWMARAKGPERVGPRELRDGVWTDLRAQFSPEAELREPCWLGKNVFVGARAIIGPRAILENGAFIEPGAVVAHSFVGPATYVGRDAELRQSVAWGSLLINWSTDSATIVPDSFVLSSLRPPRGRRQAAKLARDQFVAHARP